MKKIIKVTNIILLIIIIISSMFNYVYADAVVSEVQITKTIFDENGITDIKLYTQPNLNYMWNTQFARGNNHDRQNPWNLYAKGF